MECAGLLFVVMMIGIWLDDDGTKFGMMTISFRVRLVLGGTLLFVKFLAKCYTALTIRPQQLISAWEPDNQRWFSLSVVRQFRKVPKTGTFGACFVQIYPQPELAS